MRKLRTLLAGLGILLFSFWFWSFQAGAIRTNIYFERDFWRGVNTAAGILVPSFGPELSGGGNAFGPFFYYLLALPNKWGPHFPATVLFAEFLLAAAAALSAVVLWRRVGAAAALFFLFFFHSSHVILSEFQRLWNPAFSPLFLMAGLLCFLRTERGFLVAGGVFLGLALQVHGAVVFLVPGILGGIYLRGRKWQETAAPLVGLALAVLVFKVPAWVIAGPVASSGSIELWQSVSLFSLRLFRYSSEAFSSGPAFLAALARLVYVLFLPLGFLAFRGAKKNPGIWPLLGALVSSAPLVLPYVLEGGVARYALPFSLCLAVLSGLVLQGLLEKKSNWVNRLVVAGIGLASIALFLWQDPNHDRSDRFHRLYLSENQAICSAGMKAGITSPELLRYRLYAVGVDLDSFTPTLCRHGEEIGSGALPGAGVIVLPKGYAIKEFLPAEFWAEVETGKLQLGAFPSPAGSELEIYTYLLGPGSSYPAGIFNAGRAYKDTRQGDPVSLGDVFLLPEGDPDFSKLLPEQRGRLSLWRKGKSLEVLLEIGAAETTSPSVSEEDSWFLLGTSLRVECEKGALDIPFAEFIGTKIRFPLAPEQVLLAKNRVLAPVRRRFVGGCEGKIRAVKLNYQSAFRNWLDIQSAELPSGVL